MTYLKHSKYIVVIILISMVFIFLGWRGYVRLKDLHRKAEIVNVIHNITLYIKDYINDTGKYPYNLTEMLVTMEVTTNILNSLNDTKYYYHNPYDDSKSNDIILTVIYSDVKYEVDKSFKRTVTKIK